MLSNGGSDQHQRQHHGPLRPAPGVRQDPQLRVCDCGHQPRCNLHHDSCTLLSLLQMGVRGILGSTTIP